MIRQPWCILPTLLLIVLAGRVDSNAAEHETVRGVVYAERDSGPLKADLYVPRAEGVRPAVLVVHGGAWMTGNRGQLAGFARKLADRGYMAMAISYRLAPNHTFPAQIDDCRAAVRWMRTNAARYEIDPERIGGFGYSAGGHLVALLAAQDDPPPAGDTRAPSGRLRVAVCGGAPCDFRPMPRDARALAYWLGGTRREKPDAYRLASPAEFVSPDDPPSFFFHGETDRLVPLASPRRMVEELKKSGVEAELYVSPETAHIGALFDAQVARRGFAFLDRHLKPEGEQAAAPDDRPAAERASPSSARSSSIGPHGR